MRELFWICSWFAARKLLHWSLMICYVICIFFFKQELGWKIPLVLFMLHDSSIPFWFYNLCMYKNQYILAVIFLPIICSGNQWLMVNMQLFNAENILELLRYFLPQIFLPVPGALGHCCPHIRSCFVHRQRQFSVV